VSDHLKLKVIVIGDHSVVKLSLRGQFQCHEFMVTYIEIAQIQICAAPLERDITIDGTVGRFYFYARRRWPHTLHLAGTDCPEFYDSARGYIIVYDVTNRLSFQNDEMWHSTCCTHLGLSWDDDFPSILLANESDLPEKAVQTSEARGFAKFHGDMPFFEMSAKPGENILEPFELLLRKPFKRALAAGAEIPARSVNLDKLDCIAETDKLSLHLTAFFSVKHLTAVRSINCPVNFENQLY
jgi:hypothetical protein